MGISRVKTITFYLLAVGLSNVHASDNSILQRLEKGEVISSKIGSSFFIQALVDTSPDKMKEIFSDLRKLPKIFPQIAFAVPYVGKTKGDDDKRNFVYLKLRGLGDGVSALMEVKSGGDDAFLNAKEFVIGNDYHSGRNTAAEVDFSEERNNLELKSKIDEANSKSDSARFLGISNSLILEGPINEVMELPNVRVTINLGVASYTQILTNNEPKKAPADKKSYLVAKVSFGNQVNRGELGDIRGFGDAKLTIAQQIGTNVIRTLQSRLQK
jgi:hypothetical protein